MKWSVMISGFVRLETNDLDEAIQFAVLRLKQLGLGIDKGPWIEIGLEGGYMVKFIHDGKEIEGADIYTN